MENYIRVNTVEEAIVRVLSAHHSYQEDAVSDLIRLVRLEERQKAQLDIDEIILKIKEDKNLFDVCSSEEFDSSINKKYMLNKVSKVKFPENFTKMYNGEKL